MGEGSCVRIGKGESILAVAVPATVELFDLYEPVRPSTSGKAQFLFRLYPGYAHAKQWALTYGAQEAARCSTIGPDHCADSKEATSWTVAATQRAVNAAERALTAY